MGTHRMQCSSFVARGQLRIIPQGYEDRLSEMKREEVGKREVWERLAGIRERLLALSAVWLR